MHEDAVWAETTDGGLLRQLFGFYPTLHDSNILGVEIDRSQDRLVITVDYLDRIGSEAVNDGQELSARIRLEWTGIKSFSMPLGESELLGLTFERDAMNRIVTKFETWPGVFGMVVSDAFEAVLVQLDPGDAHERPMVRMIG